LFSVSVPFKRIYGYHKPSERSTLRENKFYKNNSVLEGLYKSLAQQQISQIKLWEHQESKVRIDEKNRQTNSITKK
jgi:hypothetical protein